jgi:GNAT superfamily N-acetyltransferase
MRTLEQLQQRLTHYGAAEYVYDPEVGYIAWHFGTGENLEPLFIEVAERRKGYGRELYRRMCRRLLAEGRPPYHSVFAYRLASNEDARLFYAALGFEQRDLGRSVYRGDGTVVMWITWDNLLRGLGLA